MDYKIENLLKNGYKKHWFNRGDGVYIYYKINKFTHSDNKENMTLSYYKFDDNLKKTK